MNNSDDLSPRVTFVGVGPGDPSLLTLAAVRAIEAASTIAYPISHNASESIALKIASDWINAKQKKLPLPLPMVKDKQALQKAWRDAGSSLYRCAAQGEKVVYLSEGDVSLFSTTSYLLFELRARFPTCSVKLIPGVTSISASAAIGGWPLAIQNDQLLLLSTPNKPSELEALLDQLLPSIRVIVFLKLGYRWSWVKPLLEKRELLEGALFAEKVGWPDQKVTSAKLVQKDEKNYFSLLLIRKDWPDILPDINTTDYYSV